MADLVVVNLGGEELLRFSRSFVRGEGSCESTPLSEDVLKSLVAAQLSQHSEHIKLAYEVEEGSEDGFADDAGCGGEADLLADSVDAVAPQSYFYPPASGKIPIGLEVFFEAPLGDAVPADPERNLFLARQALAQHAACEDAQAARRDESEDEPVQDTPSSQPNWSPSPFSRVFFVHALLDTEKMSWYSRIRSDASLNHEFEMAAPSYIRADRPCAMLAVKRYAYSLALCSDDLRDDPEVVKFAVSENGYALQFASVRMRGDKSVVLAAVSENGHSLSMAQDRMRGDREVLLAAVRSYGASLKLADELLRRDKNLVLEAVSQNGLSVQFAAEELRDDEDVGRAALKENGRALVYLSDRLRDCEDIVEDAIRKAGMDALERASERLVKCELFFAKAEKILRDEEQEAITTKDPERGDCSSEASS